ncbi:hypothetical protein NA56DRAFT_651073 [Hyaloscypha hepaticicola]|uniref:Uncharacterized protein n=1 Tax=Hyaloscypha hepaticicola TaxID=2082293 RepID=A0A2J6PJY2_9HELO|nr:hypothetical protein NA56DRAFT_651073 [Hyaloscypha hepaticicola]
MRQAVFQLDWDTFIQEEAAPKRQDWRTSVVVEEDASEAAQPPFKLRGAPLEGEKASDGPLFDLLAEPRKVKLATSDVKTKEETSPASIRLKRKAEALLSPSDGLDRRSSRSVNGGGTIVWKFTDPGANLRVQNARACCILLGITRSNSWKDMAVRCEKEINSKQRFGEEAAKRYGKMLPGP